MLNVQINILMWEESAKAWVKIKQNQLQLPRKPKYQANTCDLTRKAVAHRLFSDSFWFCLELKIEPLGLGMRASGSNACDVMMRPSVSLLIFPVPVGRPAAISANCKSTIVLHKRKNMEDFFPTIMQLPMSSIFHNPSSGKVLALAPTSFRPSVSKTLKQSVRIFTWSFSSHADNRGSMRLRNSSNLRQWFWEETPGGKSHDSPSQLEEMSDELLQFPISIVIHTFHRSLHLLLGWVHSQQTHAFPVQVTCSCQRLETTLGLPICSWASPIQRRQYFHSCPHRSDWKLPAQKARV